MKKKLKIGIIGPNSSGCSAELYQFGVKLGNSLSSKNRIFFCGGAGGFMEAVSKGLKQSNSTYSGQTIGILQGENSKDANGFIDIAIPTGVGIARNIILINASDIIISAGGGAGTLSEIAFAWQKKKEVLCITEFGGWAEELAGINLDSRNNGLLIPKRSISDVVDYLKIFEQQL